MGKSDALTSALAEALRPVVREELERVLAGRTEKTWLTRADVAELLGISTRTVANYVRRGMPSHSNGGVVRFKKDEVSAFIERGAPTLRRVK